MRRRIERHTMKRDDARGPRILKRRNRALYLVIILESERNDDRFPALSNILQKLIIARLASSDLKERLIHFFVQEIQTLFLMRRREKGSSAGRHIPRDFARFFQGKFLVLHPAKPVITELSLEALCHFFAHKRFGLWNNLKFDEVGARFIKGVHLTLCQFQLPVIGNSRLADDDDRLPGTDFAVIDRD